MKKLSIVIVVLAAVFGTMPALAADLALKAPPAPAPVFSWNGWYAGLNVGGSFGRASDSSTFGTPPAPFAATTANLDGVIGGGQIGYNWLAGSVLFGLEADIQGSSERGSADPSLIVPGVGCALAPCNSIGTLNDTEKLPWFGTVRGRLGVTPGPNWLLYVTGGLAYGQIDSDTTLTVNGVSVINNFSTTRAGWTVGGGVEGVISGNWTAKLEYLYMDFGTFSNTFTGIAPFTPFTLSTHVTDNIVRVGLNYHFH